MKMVGMSADAMALSLVGESDRAMVVMMVAMMVGMLVRVMVLKMAEMLGFL